MVKQNEIPTTIFVPPYPTDKDVEKESWARAVAGYCNGSQSVKNNDGVRSIRIGSLVYVQGEVIIDRTIEGYFLNISILPVSPRTNSFITTYAIDGTMKGIAVVAGSKEIDFTDFSDGTYYITGQYLAATKERI